jgi:peroxiredoxin-like protein
MQPLPHHYVVSASGGSSGSLHVNARGVPELESAAPAEFDGPGNRWSPEGLLCAAVASCFILTFRAVARASKLQWQSLECSADGVLERVDGALKFTSIMTKATLTVDSGTDHELCLRVLRKAEGGCLVANSLSANRELCIEIRDIRLSSVA